MSIQLNELSKFKTRFKNVRYIRIIDNVFDAAAKDIEAIERIGNSKTFGGSIHIDNVFGYANWLLEVTNHEMSCEQLLLLACAIILHDIGKNTTNENHVQASARMIERDFSKYALPDENFAQAVAYIVESHGGINPKKNNRVKSRIPTFHGVIEYGICAILLRLSDELDCTKARVHSSMDPEDLIVRFRECVSDIDFDLEAKIIYIYIRPKDINVWRFIKNHEERLNTVINEEIFAPIFNYFSNSKTIIEDDDLYNNSFWLKLYDKHNCNNVETNFALGIFGDVPEYGKQVFWQGCPYSIWDILSTHEIMNLVHCIDSNEKANIIHVIMDEGIKSNEREYEQYLFNNNMIILGSPKNNALSEILLAKTFGVGSFQYEQNKDKKIIRFGWPEEDSDQRIENNIPLSTFLCKGKEKGIYFGTHDNCELYAESQIPQNDIDEEPDCGIIVIAQIGGKYHVMISGMSGPGTLASAQAVISNKTGHLLERRDILEAIDEDKAIMALVKINTTKNNKHIIQDRNIKSMKIEKIWHYNRHEFMEMEITK